MRLKNKNKVFVRTFITYSAALIVPVVIFCCYFYGQLLRADKKAFIEASNESANVAVGRIDKSFNQMEIFSDMLMNTDWIKKVYSSSDIIGRYLNHIKKLEISSELSVYKSAVSIADEICIAMPKKDTYVTSKSWGDASFLFYSLGIEEEKSKKLFTDWISETDYFSITTADNIPLVTTKPNGILISRAIDLNTTNPRAYMVYWIEKSSIDKELAYLLPKNMLSFEIKSAQNETLYKYGENDLSNNEPYLVTIPNKAFSTTYEIRFDNPYKSFSFRNLYLVSSLFLILSTLFIAASYWLARISYKPIKKIISLNDFSDLGKATDEFDSIERLLKSLKEEKKELAKNLSLYTEAARSNCLNDLMRGLFNEEKISARLIKHDIPYKNNQYFCVNIISYDELYLSEDSEHDFNLFLAITSCLLSQKIEFDLFEKHNNQIAVIFSLDEKKSDEIFDNINKKIKSYIKTNYDIEIKAYNGTPMLGLLGISKSYQNAKRLMQEDTLKRNVGIDRAYSLLKIPYYYPTDWEFQLINQLKIGQEETAITIINELEKENLELSLPQDMMIKVTLLIFETMIRIMKEMNIKTDEAASMFDSSVIVPNAANQWDCLRKIAALVCSRPVLTESGLGKQLFDYVLKNYSDCELSLKSLSDKFSLSVSAISKTFKSSAGINFLDYLTRLRMEKAKELLKTTNNPVLDISRMVGYDNNISFKRAFFRYTGIKPTEYRSMK